MQGFLARECPTSRVRDAEPLGFDAGLWAKTCELGGPGIGIADDRGGSGGDLVDLALVAEQLGASLAPVPFVESVVCARALQPFDEPAAADALTALVAGSPAVGAVALRPAHPDGVAALVPGGAVADHVLGIDGDDLVLLHAGPGSVERPANLGCAPLADRSLRGDGCTRLASGPAARGAHQAAVDEWRVLTAAALVGLAASALTLGVDYAKERHQFGVPIGSFQSIAHRLADLATAVDGAQLLSREAAWAQVGSPATFPELASMAFAFASRAAQRTAELSLHVHGGYGFMLEYDIQLHYRRAKAWSLVAGDPRSLSLQLADQLFGDRPLEETRA
jgi:alkylation response protein AidB-like acyl-CoA dehydrogenase